MLIASLRRRPRDVVWLAVWFGIQALPSVASGWTVAKASQDFLAGRVTGGIGWLGLLALSALAGAAGTRQGYLRLGAIVEPLRDELIELIVAGALRQSMDTTRPPDTGAVGRMTHQAEIVRDSYAGLLAVTCTFAATTASSLAGLVTLVPATLPYVIPPLLGAVAIMWLLLRPFASRQRRSVTGEEVIAGSAAEAVAGLRDVAACGAEEPVRAELRALIERQARAARSVARIGAVRLAGVTAASWLPLLLVVAAGPSLLHGGLAPAYLIGAVTYVSGSLRSTLYTLSQGIGAGMARLTVTLDRIIEASTPPASGTARRTHSRNYGTNAAVASEPGMKLTNVTFGYGDHAEPVISDLTLDIAPGEHLAIVGPSGVGKSTLAWLLAGMLRPTAGEVVLDGVSIPDYAPDELPARRVLIPQEAYVFSGTLAENIWYLRGTADPPSDAELDAAAAAVGLRPLVSRLGGYGATVRPASLSAGERQLIALARAYVSTAPIAILDEATCHLDLAAEARAEHAFACRPGTLIVIAHRISSALRAGRVLVLDGTSARAGDHSSMLASSAMYRNLVGYWTSRPEENPGRVRVG